MFNLKIIYTALLACGLLMACSQRSVDALPPDPGNESGTAVTKAPVTFNAEESGLTVFAFRERAEGFVFEKSVYQGWTTEDERIYKLTTDLPLGRYKFIFAKTFGNTLRLAPAPAAGVLFDDVAFVLSEAEGGYYAAADELYLQHDDVDDPSYIDPAHIYSVYDGTPISVKLKRAVARVDVNVKRGYSTGTNDDGSLIMEEVEYSDGDDVLNYIKDIELVVSNAGSRVGILGGQGSVEVFHSFQPSDAVVDADGFAAFEGPLLIPNGGEQTLDIVITPAEGKGYPVLRKSGITASLKRNQQLIVDLWVDRVWPEIIVTVSTSEIVDTRDGDLGIWD